MRHLLLGAMLLISVFSCKKVPLESTVQYACAGYVLAEGYFDGETIWWNDDQAAFTFDNHYQMEWDESTFVLTTDLDVCTNYFQVIKTPDPEFCPFQPYSTSWSFPDAGTRVLTVQFPASIEPCTQMSGQAQRPYWFRFRLYYQPAPFTLSPERLTQYKSAGPSARL